MLRKHCRIQIQIEILFMWILMKCQTNSFKTQTYNKITLHHIIIIQIGYDLYQQIFHINYCHEIIISSFRLIDTYHLWLLCTPLGKLIMFPTLQAETLLSLADGHSHISCTYSGMMSVSFCPSSWKSYQSNPVSCFCCKKEYWGRVYRWGEI